MRLIRKTIIPTTQMIDLGEYQHIETIIHGFQCMNLPNSTIPILATGKIQSSLKTKEYLGQKVSVHEYEHLTDTEAKDRFLSVVLNNLENYWGQSLYDGRDELKMLDGKFSKVHLIEHGVGTLVLHEANSGQVDFWKWAYGSISFDKNGMLGSLYSISESLDYFDAIEGWDPGIGIELEGKYHRLYSKAKYRVPVFNLFQKDYHLRPEGKMIMQKIHMITQAQTLVDQTSNLERELNARLIVGINKISDNNGHTEWITISDPTPLSENPQLLVSAKSNWNAKRIYQEFSTPPPKYALENKICLSDLPFDSLKFILAQSRGDIVLVNEESVKLANDRKEDFKFRLEMINVNWKIMFANILSAQRIRTTIFGGGGKQKYALIDAFKNFLAVVNPVTGWHGEYNSRSKIYKGFSDSQNAFYQLKQMALAIEEQWPKLGDRFIHWMTNRKLNLLGDAELNIGNWQTWNDADFYNMAEKTFGYRQTWEAFNNVEIEAVNHASNLVYSITLLTHITRDTKSPSINIRPYSKIGSGYNLKSFKTVLNNFVAILSQIPIQDEYFTISALNKLTDPSANTAALKEGGAGKWRHFSYNFARIMEIFSYFSKSLYGIGQSSEQGNLIEADFNNYMKSMLEISSTMKWNPSSTELTADTDHWRLSDFKEIKRYIGARDVDNRYTYMGEEGAEIVNFDSGPETYIAYWATHLRIDSLTTEDQFIGGEESGVQEIYDREYYRNLPSDQMPMREINLQFDNPPKNNPNRREAECILDVGIRLPNGQIVHIEHLGKYSPAYAGKKNLAIEGYRAKQMAVMYTYDDSDAYGEKYISKSERIVTEHPFLGIFELIPAFFNVIHMNARQPAPFRNLPLNEALAAARANPSAYYITAEEGRLLCEKFRIDEEGQPYGNDDFFRFL